LERLAHGRGCIALRWFDLAFVGFTLPALDMQTAFDGLAIPR